MAYLAWKGPSVLDGKPIMALITGVDKPSSNRKTGPMAQLWILREDIEPLAAVKTGNDVSICGDCKLRGDGAGKERGCYVLVFQAPQMLHKHYRAGQVKPLPDRMRFHRGLRLGAYGDPAAVPVPVIKELVARSEFTTGYTHQWRTCDPELKHFLMASCETLADRESAKALGWATFRTGIKHPGETLCPASEEAGHKADCFSCRKCRGTGAKDVVIQPHGGGKKHVMIHLD